MAQAPATAIGRFSRAARQLGYADYLGALERLRIERLHDPTLLPTANWLIDYPFADRLYPGALKVVEHVRQWGQAVILSDGDAIFQPRKVARSGLWDAFAGRALIYVHKETELADVERWHPAAHYVLVDDKTRILAAVKAIWGDAGHDHLPEAGPLCGPGAAARRGVGRSGDRPDRRSHEPRSVETDAVICDPMSSPSRFGPSCPTTMRAVILPYN